jgi:hypothetical protein
MTESAFPTVKKYSPILVPLALLAAFTSSIVNDPELREKVEENIPSFGNTFRIVFYRYSQGYSIIFHNSNY